MLSKDKNNANAVYCLSYKYMVMISAVLCCWLSLLLAVWDMGYPLARCGC